MADPTEFFLPPSFSYPITVTSLDAPVKSKVTRGTRLLSYSYVYRPKDPSEPPSTRFGTWDSTAEGDVTRWNIKVGDVLSSSQASQKAVVLILEPCKHGVQLGGLCALCGKDLTIIDYTGYSDASRASIQMTHSAFGPTVSLEEAQRIERETANHLLASRKLSLIVDLDQTIVHATVDPTVGEWIAEGESWEAKQAKKQAKSTTPTDSDDSSDDDSDEEEECNPNWEALKDVKKFRLGPESFGSPSSARSKGKHKMVENEGCMYYIKARPGWKEFLERAATKYEMHVYTMGTRAYAEQVCAILDPDKKIFGNRLLSRDESGSLTQKNLKRLFPCDTSMVVIIDDRADVWEWSPNLVKVIPYDFFVGIGDINSNFLPKIDPSTLASTPVAPTTPPSTSNGPQASESTSNPEAVNGDTAGDSALLNESNAALDAQLEERPLAKKEKELQEHEEEEEEETEQTQIPDNATASAPPSESNAHEHHHHRKALLKNDDTELQRVGKLLDEVHNRFFNLHDSTSNNHRKKSNATKPDVTRIIPKMRTETLEACHILFSGLIPLDTKPETAEVWRSATMFGAKCHTELSSEVTHVVAAKRGTVKVDQARKRGNIAIVSQLWLTDSIGQWRKMDEKPYLLEELEVPTAATHPPTSSPVMDIHEISSDPGMDEDDGWHKDPSELDPASIDWNEINAEVDAAMNESDDEDETGYIGFDDGQDHQSERSIDEYSDDGSVKSLSANNSPRMKRKRLRSLTPSEAGLDADADLLRSPLAKRKKVAADRSGLSRLKEGITASDIHRPKDAGSESGSTPASPIAMQQDSAGDGEDDDDEEEEEDEGFDLDDDFLARALEEEDEEVG